MSFLYDSNIVVALGLGLFFAILFYYGVHKLLFGMLDARAERIRAELNEARALREEAQKTFAEFERKQKDVAKQAEEIVENARAQAHEAADKAKADLAASIERRLKAADEQIALAEQRAVKEVRDKAATVAVAAARQVLTERIGDDQGTAMIDAAIQDVGQRLH
ncbi:MAG: ATP F0F1 synthase subunit B [Pseudomonadota bacterium]